MKFLKFLKYEFLDNFASIAIINAILLILIFSIRFIFSGLHDGNIPDSLMVSAGIFAFILPLGFFGSFVFLIIIIVKSFAKLFDTQGYLIFSLPIRLDSILLSKIIINSFWILISSFVCYLWIAFASIGTDSFVELNKFFGFLKAGFWQQNYIMIIASFLMVLKFILMIFLAFAFLNIGKISNFRSVLGIVIFFIINIIDGIFSGILHGIFGLNRYGMAWQDLCILVLMIGIYYIFIRFLIKNKLEI